jgi:hypothetical protein
VQTRSVGFERISDKDFMKRDLLFREHCIQLLRSGNKLRTIETAGVSMYPLIQAGSTLTYLPPAVDRCVKAGDIALFERSGILVAHRIIGRFHLDGVLWFREKGDNTSCTGTFPASSLIGRVIFIEHNGCVRDLTRLRQRIAGRLAGIYWLAFFAFIRSLSAFRRRVGWIAVPRLLRTIKSSAFRVLNRLPVRFIRS